MNSAFATLEQRIPEEAQRMHAIFEEDVIEGLSRTPKQLPCKYFYDETGSSLFDAICDLDEYYLTRTELQIMEQFASEMGQQIGTGAMLVEFGSGSSIKTRRLLDKLPRPTAYVPVDISDEHLHGVAGGLAAEYSDIEILPVCADFTEPFELPDSKQPLTHTAVYFPGSTIGNLEPDRAIDLLHHIASLCGTGGGLLIGVDLQKDHRVLEAAYNDANGVTAEFNLNLLVRIQRELGASLDVAQFKHHAFYNASFGRIEIYLKSLVDQQITIGEHSFALEAGELIHTEYSHKYTIDGFSELAAQVGLTLRKSWTDKDERFAVLHFAILGDR